MISLAYTLGLIYLVRRSESLQLSRRIAMDLALILMIGGFVGSRLFHVIWEHPEHYWARPSEIFKVWQGGFVFYGGVIGAVVPAWFFLKFKQESIGSWLWALAPIAPLVYAIGRLATLLSGSGYGSPSDLPWAITFPPGTEAPAGVPVHPTQIYAMVWELGLWLIIVGLEKRNIRFFAQAPVRLFYLLMVGHGLGRGLVEQFRADFRGEMPLGLTVSTWISLTLVAWGLSLLVFSLKKSALGSARS